MSTSYIQKIEKGLKSRKKGKPVRFVYDKEIDPGLLEFLIRKLQLTRKDAIIPGGRIHNFRHFMDFPESVFLQKGYEKKPITHPALVKANRVTDVILKKDLMLHFPYHSFKPMIDLLREAAMDEKVTEIKITAYRLAPNSKIINALINAVRNGKKVTVMLELGPGLTKKPTLSGKSDWKTRG